MCCFFQCHVTLQPYAPCCACASQWSHLWPSFAHFYCPLQVPKVEACSSQTARATGSLCTFCFPSCQWRSRRWTNLWYHVGICQFGALMLTVQERDGRCHIADLQSRLQKYWKKWYLPKHVMAGSLHATELVLDSPGFSETFDLLDSTWLLQVVTSLS